MSTLKFLKFTFFVYILQVALVKCVYSQCPRRTDIVLENSTVQLEKHTPLEDLFAEDPLIFLANRDNALINDCIGKPGSTIPINGESGSFGLSRLSDNTGYHFYFKQRGQAGIHATYLQTKASITISQQQTNTLVATPMLQGCSIYVRRDPGGTLTIFHHYRERKDQLECTIEGCYVEVEGQRQRFDDVYSFEEYNGADFDDPNAATCDLYRPRGFTMASLTFLYMRSGSWWFLDQTVCYDQTNPIGHFVNLQWIDLKFRQIKLRQYTTAYTTST